PTLGRCCQGWGLLLTRPHCDNRTKSHLLAFSSCPLGLDLYNPLFPIQVVTETAPGPVLRSFDQTAHYRVAVYIPQLLDTLALAPDIEVVIAALPEMRTFETEHASD